MSIAANEKQVTMQEEAQPCASWWGKTLCPKRVRFLAVDTPIVEYVCLPLNHPTFFHLCNLSASFREEKWKKTYDKRVLGFNWQAPDMSRQSTAQHYHIDTPFRTIRKKSRYLEFRHASDP